MKKKNRYSKTVSNPLNNQLVPFKDVYRIGVNYYYRKNEVLFKTNEHCVKTDYGTKAIYAVKKYFSFKNEPNHKKHKQELDCHYNLYKKLLWKPKKGKYPHVVKMLKHIFKGEHYNMILTYFYVMYCQPKHSLPAIGLVGNQSTGKSKFLELVLAMFEPNTKSIDPEDLTASFNEGYVDKLVIVIDEKISGKERITVMRKLKKLITGGTQNRKGKFVSDIDINFFGKIFMASNDTEDMLALESENTRFWIIEVQKLKSDDLDILEKAKKEIPAFFHYLDKKFKPLERASRLWLSVDSFHTDAARKMQENARPEIIKAIINNLVNYFLENEDKTEIHFTAEQFIATYDRNKKWNSNWFSKDVKKFFKKTSKAQRRDNPFFDITTRYNSSNTVGTTNEIKQRRYYHFSKKEIYALNDKNELNDESKHMNNEDYDEDDEVPF